MIIVTPKRLSPSITRAKLASAVGEMTGGGGGCTREIFLKKNFVLLFQLFGWRFELAGAVGGLFLGGCEGVTGFGPAFFGNFGNGPLFW